MEEQIRTLVVDDDEGVRFFVGETLRRVGHSVMEASTGDEALERLREGAFDLVVLDLKLGGRLDGIRVLEAAKWRWPDAVVVILTAHGSLESAISAIREGVDGYLLKPVEQQELRRSVEELLARKHRLSGDRETTGEADVVRRGPFAVDLSKHVATMHGQPLELTSHEFKLLAYLVQNAHRVVSPRELVRVVRDYDADHTHEARQIVKWYVHRLRRKIEPDSTKPRYILNVRGVGYSFRE